MKNIGKRGLAIFLIFAMLLSVPSLIISVAAASGTEVDLYVDTVTAMPENTVQVTVQLQNNPGLSSLKFDIAYDSYLSLENVTFGQEFGAYVLAPTPYKNPQTISFISPLEEVNANGTFATLTFRVSANAPDNYAADITVECDEENVFSGDLSPVNVNVHNGCVNIIHGIPGDIDGDRKVNNKDAIMLFRYVAGGEVAVDEAALDVNCDGKVNNKDAITLFRYVAGWDVEIGRGPSSIACRHDKTEIILGFMPTCTEAGLSDEERCTACGELLRASVAIPPLGHDFEDGFCTRCGEQDENYDPDDPLDGSRGLQYRSNGDGTCAVIGIGTCTAEDLVIPAYSPNGDLVIEIGEEAFLGCTNLTSIEIPDSVTVIQKDAFCDCTGLTSAVIPDSVTRVDNGVLARCSSLVWVEISNNLNMLSKDMFNGCSSLTSVVIPAGVISIGSNAFMDCCSLSSVVIPDDVVEIGSGAFACTALSTIDIPDSVTVLGNDVFNGCSFLKSIVIPDGVTRLGSHAFYDCYSLTSITIPATVTEIDFAAFLGCYALTDVYFGGTSTDWDVLWIGSYNDALDLATIHCNESNPNAPLYIATPEIINDYAQADPNNGLYNSDIGSSEIIRQGDRSFLRLTSRGVDPYVVFTNPLQSVEIGRYMAISYRTNSVSDGQFFMGSGYGWTGRGDNIIFDWNEDGAWNLAIIDLENVGLTSIEDNILTYARIDFFTEAGAEGDYFDIEYIAFFNSFEAAEKYDFDLHEIPMWTTQSGVITHLSFDQLYLGTGEANDSEQTNIFFFPGQSLDWDLIAEVNPQTVDYLTYWGWVGIMDSVGQFGYRINGNTPVYDDAWTHETEDEVYYTAMMTGADTASRMKIAIPVDGLSGDNTVCVLYRHPDGREVCLTKFELIVSEDIVMPDIPDEPDDPDIPGPPAIGSYDVPMDIWSVSGHASGITSSDDWALGPMIHAAGLDKAALLHQGAIGVGELDLSMYSHAIIYFGCDNSSVTEERYNESANNRIILSKVDTHMINSPEEEDIIAAETYTLYGWLPEAVIIDLTDIDYQGPVYVTYDTLPGTFMLISSIEFVVPEDEEAEIVWGDDSKFTVCPDNVSNWVGNSKKDWCVERGDVYMASVKNTIVVNGFDFISFRGWANPTYKGIEIDSFGYQINDERPVFKETFMIKEPSLNEALNSSAARRYEGIKIPVADLEVGSYNIKLLVKDTNGVVYSMNHAWNGDITFVKKEFSDKPDTDFDIDWTTYRSASDYEEPEYGEEPSYRPAPGYEYTDEGFHMISADYTDTTPFGTIQTKTPVDLQNGFYMEIRVDDYPYGGQDGMADHWISFHIWDSQNIAPGNVLDYGQGWLNLCRTPGNGNIGPAQSFICSSAGAGSFLYQGDVAICPLLDENGKEIYTFEVVYDRGEYLIYICDVLIQGTANIANHLNSLNQRRILCWCNIPCRCCGRKY